LDVFLYSIIISILLVIGLALIIGQSLCAHAKSALPTPPDHLPITNISIPRRRGGHLHAWWLPGQPDKPIILHLHGNRNTREQMLQRAELFHQHGYGGLLPDFQAHGESDGKHVSYGFFESEDARDWIRYIRTQYPHHKLGVIGLSLGGAACLVGPEPLEIEAIVLEMVYPTLHEAVDNRARMHFGAVGSLLTPLLTLQLKPILGFSIHDLRPIDGIQNLTIPKLIIAGSDDQHTTLAQSKRLFEAAAEPKTFWLIDGAKHEDLQAFTPQHYETRVLAFFEEWL